MDECDRVVVSISFEKEVDGFVLMTDECCV
jgi:hypothetical protein